MGQIVKMRLRQDVADMREEAEDEFFEEFPYFPCKAMYGRRASLPERKKYFDALSLSTVVGDAPVRTQVQKWDKRSVLNLTWSGPLRGAAS